ncbi:cryptochrome/photolyase family protein [Rhodovibrio salinarum]
MSPHLHFGEIGPRQIWAAVQHRMDARNDAQNAATAYLQEIGWREFSYHLLYWWPSLPEETWKDNFKRFPWADDPDGLRAWQRGITGYPIVDAGMRELYRTGWMHNRVRMIVGSFLVKDLLIHWREGEAWFWDTLVDADLASNAASWQWIAGCGADAAPYFRIFNPVTQGQKFDPEGAYVRHWVPEIARLPDKYLHAPWTAPDRVLADARVRLGTTYPQPIVDHKAARQRALDAFQQIKQG